MPRFNTFDEVVRWYDTTKPLVSKHHTKENDVRPIAERNRKWERIKKVDDNTYVLADGNYGNTMWMTPSDSSFASTDEFENRMGPIKWERRADGDYITVTHHRVGFTSVTRYNFLHDFLPAGLKFNYNQSGEHWLYTGGNRYMMGKGALSKTVSNSRTAPLYTLTGDENSLEFRVNPDGTFTRTGKPSVRTTRLVDKEKKLAMKPLTDRVWEDIMLYCPMLDTSWVGHSEYRHQIFHHEPTKQKYGAQSAWRVGSLSTNFVEDVLNDQEHELYVPLLALIGFWIGFKQAPNYARANYQRSLNKIFNLYKTEEN